MGLFGCVRGGGEVRRLRLKWGTVVGDQHVGAIVGWNEGVIQDCVVKGAMTRAGGYAGGVAGSNSGTIAECAATGKVMGSGNFVGGLTGRNYGTLGQSCTTGVISGNSGVGGLAGANTGGTITQTFAACRVTVAMGAVVGGLCSLNSGTVTASFWNTDTSLVTVSAGGTGLSMKAMRTRAPYADAGWDFATTWGIVEGDSYPYLLGQTTIDEINSIDQLQLIGVIYPLDGDFVLTRDINASATASWDGGKGFNPIGATGSGLAESFTGRFYGRGHVINGLRINRPDEDEGTGLFRYLWGEGEIVHLNLEDCSVTGRDNVGGLVYAVSESGTVFGCHVTGSVTGASADSSYIGGLIGANYGTVCDSYTTCSDVANGFYGGGLAGANYGVILRCRSGGTVTGSGSCVGGLIGANALGATAKESYATTAINGKDYAGGLAGTNNGAVTECYATGTVTGKQHVGGLLGLNQDGAVDTCYSAGAVGGDFHLGGLVGTNAGSSSVAISFWDTETSGMVASSGGTGLTTEQMQAAASFTGWDFVNVWGIDEGESYPYLLAVSPDTTPGGGCFGGTLETAGRSARAIGDFVPLALAAALVLLAGLIRGMVCRPRVSFECHGGE